MDLRIATLEEARQKLAELKLESTDMRAKALDKSTRDLAAHLKLEVAALILVDEEGEGHVFVDGSFNAQTMFQDLADSARVADSE